MSGNSLHYLYGADPERLDRHWEDFDNLLKTLKDFERTEEVLKTTAAVAKYAHKYGETDKVEDLIPLLFGPGKVLHPIREVWQNIEAWLSRTESRIEVQKTIDSYERAKKPKLYLTFEDLTKGIVLNEINLDSLPKSFLTKAEARETPEAEEFTRLLKEKSLGKKPDLTQELE